MRQIQKPSLGKRVAIVVAGLASLVGCSEEEKVKEEKREGLRELGREILRKAEMYDSEVGLSVRDKARLAHELGYEVIIQDGDYLVLEVNKYDEPILEIVLTTPGHNQMGSGNWRTFKVDEKVARTYVGEESVTKGE